MTRPRKRRDWHPLTEHCMWCAGPIRIGEGRCTDGRGWWHSECVARDGEPPNRPRRQQIPKGGAPSGPGRCDAGLDAQCTRAEKWKRMALALRACTCGHDRSSHYATRTGERTTCLCNGCGCQRYRDRSKEPDPALTNRQKL